MGLTPALRDLPDDPAVITIAGSGEFGNVDGPARAARFMEPVAVAYARDGGLYILDRAAERLKLLKDGVVQTVAGSGAAAASWSGVGGGYRDGPALSARFDQPAAIAVGPDGAVYIADSKNHCIRRFSAGVVSTFAGAPGRAGHLDGPRTAASFSNPLSLAFDSKGDLFIADFPMIRRIDGDGNVTSITFSFSVVSVAIMPSPDRLIVTGPNLLQIDDLTGTKKLREVDASLFGGWEGMEMAGPASQVVAIDPYSLVYADPFNKTVRFVSVAENSGLAYTRAIGEIPNQSAANRGGGFEDGRNALFEEPLGLSVDARENIAVADTGNRRIRLIPRFNRVTFHYLSGTNSELPQNPEPHAFRIALFGNSQVLTNLGFQESIAGTMQRELAAAPSLRRCGLSARVYPVSFQGLQPARGFQYINEVLSSGVVDYVVYLYPGQQDDIDPESLADLNADAVGKIETQARAAGRALASNGVGWTVVTLPGTYDLFGESLFYKRPKKAGDAQDTIGLIDPNTIVARRAAVTSMLHRASAPVLDAWPVFLADYQGARRSALFGSGDHHLTPHGAALLAQVISSTLVQGKPWGSKCHA